jgi:RTX calcium-binding nonapeptide repeat (4 copies)
VLGGSAGAGGSTGRGGFTDAFGGRGEAGVSGATGGVTFDGDSGGAGGRGGRGGGGAGLGGAIFIDKGGVTIVNSRFVNNRAVGGTGFENGEGVGGAIFNRAGSLFISGLSFDSNSATTSSVNIGNFSRNFEEIPVPVAQIALPGSAAENPSRTINGTINLDRFALVDLTLNYTVSGTATAGQDVAALSGKVAVPKGSSSVNLPIQILDDQLFDPNESITITLTPGLGYAVSTTQPSSTLVIADDEIGGPVDPTGQWLGSGGQRNFIVRQGQQRTAIDFQGIGRGTNPSPELVKEVDTIQFAGKDLVPEHLLLTQQGSDLLVHFDDDPTTQALLKNFQLENLDNLTQAAGATVNLGNILFDGQTQFEDSFDVFNANETRNTVFNRNSVTFLNDLDNTVSGFDDSDDAINGQGGNDCLTGLSGDDILRGGDGNDRLFAGTGADILVGGAGADSLTGGAGADTFRLSLGDSLLNNFDRITDLQIGTDSINSPTAVTAANVAELGAVTSLTAGAIENLLNTTTFGANSAATFSLGDRTFLALNDGISGFSASTDSILEITGFSGNLSNLQVF